MHPTYAPEDRHLPERWEIGFIPCSFGCCIDGGVSNLVKRWNVELAVGSGATQVTLSRPCRGIIYAKNEV